MCFCSGLRDCIVRGCRPMTIQIVFALAGNWCGDDFRYAFVCGRAKFDSAHAGTGHREEEAARSLGGSVGDVHPRDHCAISNGGVMVSCLAMPVPWANSGGVRWCPPILIDRHHPPASVEILL